jgi:hypothetical protein
MSRLWFGFRTRTVFAGRATNDAWVLTTESVGRENSDESPYLIPNEWICGQLAQFLRLPVPPFALMRRNSTRKGMFASLRFGVGDTPPNDTRPQVLVQRHPRLCAGILLFDVLVANEDRHTGNISVDDPVEPREVRIFDHDRAIFGCFRNYGPQRLRNLQVRLGVSGGSGTGGCRHCLLDAITTDANFVEWYGRIADIPDWFINEICDEVRGLGAKKACAEAACRFLKRRKRELPELIRNHRNEFPSVRQWGVF